MASTVRERVILSRKEGESSKCLNELLMSRMSRFRTSHSATLAALTGSTITNPVKEEQTGKFTLTRSQGHSGLHHGEMKEVLVTSQA